MLKSFTATFITAFDKTIESVEERFNQGSKKHVSLHLFLAAARKGKFAIYTERFLQVSTVGEAAFNALNSDIHLTRHQQITSHDCIVLMQIIEHSQKSIGT